MPRSTAPMPRQESSHERSAQSARSYDGRGSPAKPSAALRSRPRWSSTLLDHVVRPHQDRLRDRQAEGLRGLQIYHELEFRRLLDGEVGRLRALEDLVHVGGGAPEEIGKAHTVGHEPPGLHELALWMHYRQPALDRDGCKLVSGEAGTETEQHQDSVRTPLARGSERGLDILGSLRLQVLKLHCEGFRRELCFSERSRVAGLGRRPKDGHPREPRNDFPEELESLSVDLRVEGRQSSDVPAGSGKTGDEPVPDRIVVLPHHDGDCVGSFLGSPGRGRASRNDNRYLETHELGRQFTLSIEPSRCISILNDNVSLRYIAEIPQSLAERLLPRPG